MFSGWNNFLPRCGGVAFALLGATQFAAASDGDAAKQFGLLGNWAPTCDVPAAPDNPHQTFALSADGTIALTMKTGGKAPDTVITIRNLQPAGTDKITGQWSVPNGKPVTVTLQKQGSRIHSWESLDATGKKMIDKGVFVAVGKPAPWASKCG